MAAPLRAGSALRWWGCVTVSAFVICLAQGPLFAQRNNARYVGGTLDAHARPNLTFVEYRCKSRKGILDVTSDSNLVFRDDVRLSLTLGYDRISSLRYGLDSVGGDFCYPWDSYEQFTKKRHYLLTVVFHDPRGEEEAVVFELEKAAVRPTLARLEARSGKHVEFTNAVACVQYKTADECGHGQPGELKGLTKVFIETRFSAERDLIAAEIAASQLGLTVLGDAQGAEILLRYIGGQAAETRFGELGAGGGKPMSAGRGEVSVVRDGRRRVVIMFEDFASRKHPATNFGRTFVEAYKKTTPQGARPVIGRGGDS